jgi:hypothetical protein
VGVRMIYTAVYPNGSALHFKGDIRQYFVSGNGPSYCPGVRLENWEDDGSPEWSRLFEEVEVGGPVRAMYGERYATDARL